MHIIILNYNKVCGILSQQYINTNPSPPQTSQHTTQTQHLTAKEMLIKNYNFTDKKYYICAHV